MSTVSLDELLEACEELALVGRPPEVVVVLREPVDVDLDPVLVLGPNRRVDAVVEADPVDFRVLRALRPRRRATKAQKHTRMGE